MVSIRKGQVTGVDADWVESGGSLQTCSRQGGLLRNGDEGDELDEALCPFDVQPSARNFEDSGLILDDELGVLFRRLAGREVVAIVDSCHSGTMTRSIRGTPVSRLEQTPAFQSKYLVMDILGEQTRGAGTLPSLGLPKQEDVPPGQISFPHRGNISCPSRWP